VATTIGAGGRVDLGEHGIDAAGRVHLHPSTSLLYTHTLRRDEGRLAEGGPLVVDTGRHTGRSPKDKFVVREPDSLTRRSTKSSSRACATRSLRFSSARSSMSSTPSLGLIRGIGSAFV
jgi:ATP-dependent phosphoenolpyruvate carboxykinase